MAQSKASQDRENVAESLRRFGFGPAGIEAVFAMEDAIATKPRRSKPEPAPTLFDF